MCVGPLVKLYHWGPLTAIGIIKAVSFATIHCSSQWWPPEKSLGGVANSSIFLLLSASTIYNFLNSVYQGPGVLPRGWQPKDPENRQFLQYCQVCEGYKAPRSHHCKKCGFCVLKMDHHCPWINSCVGHQNHTSFTLFLFFAVLGCAQATCVLGGSIYRAIYRNWYLYHGTGEEPVVILSFYVFAFCVFSFGLAIGVVLAVGMLLYFQLRSICKNKTAIEDWIVEKAVYRRQLARSQGEEMEPFIYPYNLGILQNFRQVINSSLSPVGNGIEWPVVPGCDQFTLTKEQMAQKVVKKLRSRRFTAMRNYAGYRLPVVFGPKVMCTPPCTDEPRMALSVGDIVLVTRYSKHWLYGERWEKWRKDNLPAERGWFPRCCVVPVVEDEKKDK